MEKGIFLKNKFILFVIPLILLLLAPPLYYFYRQYNTMRAEYEKTKLQLNKSSTVLGDNTEEVIDKVGKLIELPNETPTVANITDKTKLQGQSFFARAQNGDKVLIFQKAKKAIIYREATNKIIEVGTINIDESVPASEISPTIIPTAISPAATATPTSKVTPAKNQGN
ncbi:hypothetical protein HYT32_00030 [Candidatus Roizmanbacteria bacterium]|nr:hypothetical protein [Candidatus Roizmanbacteria bacterium]